MNVTQAVNSRRSVRQFEDRPVPYQTVYRILEVARMAPSGCNFQPWEAVVLTGEPLRHFQEKLLASNEDDPYEYDFLAPAKFDKYRARQRAVGAAMYGAMEIERYDSNRRAAFAKSNILSFGAPALLLCHFPKAMKEAQWADVGMWLQTIMLLARDEGLDTCPQEYFGLYGRTIKAYLSLPMEHMLFCGMAIGWRNAGAPINNFERERAPLEEQVRFLGFD